MGCLLDQNKRISSIGYNHLNLPERIQVTGKGTIEYLYDALGRKHRKTVTDSTGTPVKVKVTDYINGFIYEDRKLREFAHEEGRVRAVYATNQPIGYAFDYFEKDHLGNIRVVLTDQTQMSSYVATMETQRAATETQLFSNVDETRVPRPAGYPSEAASSENRSVSKLSAKEGGRKIGPSLVLKVMAGDTVKIGAQAFYKSNGPQDNSSRVQPETMLADLALNFAGGQQSAGGHAATDGDIRNPFNTSFSNSDYRLLQEKDPSENRADRPKAYLSFVLFDENFKLVDKNSGVRQVKSEPDQLQTLAVDEMPIEQSGYLYVFTSNETNQDVYFDNVVVTLGAGPLLEETHYYPFGLTMAGISSKALNGTPENKYKFTGQLFDDDLGWNTYQMRFRTMDPQIGRFLQVDPLSPKYVHNSTYAYAENDVIRAIDIEGLEKYIVTMRAFIPQKTIGNPNPFSSTKTFAGDNRTQYQANATNYRTQQSVKADFDNKSMSLQSNTASGSIGYDKNGKVNETSSSGSAGSVKGNVSAFENAAGKPTAAVIDFETTASNKLVTGAPAIDASMTITITPQDDGTFNFSIKGSTDGFPAYELWVTDDKGNSVLVFGRNPIESGEGPGSLFPPMEHSYDYSGNSKNATKGPVVNFGDMNNTREKNNKK
ncbi:RHS repeat-associated protein [Chitinophaga terrae (ex Kim and Jung 2007)]|uniref:RHS repeat-associated core domain-containing protein n=1 Tax=Chitinophaga terrae (ex Kim and Jung 2007) TaxID=408074 RepID=UPI0027854A3F|nr:RHS repeat-associated core domain-containing protein [Chitinophaga terrae (ex Kim and Jung 2007)]MDQ0105042.1 RHS repeat-associated protein [Chitinophaga terrae (ex Kim and Jung 2007)]